MNNHYCQLGKHEAVNQHSGMSYYEDPVHGIPRFIPVCDECLLEHVRKYYPGSQIERGILNLRPELKLPLDTGKAEG